MAGGEKDRLKKQRSKKAISRSHNSVEKAPKHNDSKAKGGKKSGTPKDVPKVSRFKPFLLCEAG